MAKAALPSLAASLLLHLALPLGAGVQALRVSRAPLSASQPTELELVPLAPAPPAQAPLEAPAAGTTELAPVAERAPPSRPGVAPEANASAPAAPVVPAALPLEMPTPVSRSAEPARVDPPSAASPNGAAPSVAGPSVSEPGAPASGTASSDTATAGTAATGAALGTSGAATRGSGGPAAAPRASGDSDAERRALRAAYLQQLRLRVLGHRVYPYLARRARLEGTVCLRVSLNGQGDVARLVATCEAPAPLLEAALSAVRTAAPFGPLPSQLGGAITVDIPVVFQLEAL